MSCKVRPDAYLDQFDLCLCMLIWIAVGSVGAVGQRADCPIIFLAPAVDILPAGLVVDRSGCNTVLQRVLNYCLLKSHVLCYLIHSG